MKAFLLMVVMAFAIGCSAQQIKAEDSVVDATLCAQLAKGAPELASACPRDVELAAAIATLIGGAVGATPQGAEAPPRFVSAKDIGAEIARERQAKAAAAKPPPG